MPAPPVSKRLLYRCYRIISDVQYWIRRRFTNGGQFVFTGLVLAAMVGVDTTRTLAYQVFALLFCLLAFSIAFSLVWTAKFGAQRQLPRYGSVGVPLTYRVRLVNRTSKPQAGLFLLENLVDPRPTLREFIEQSEPGEAERSWLSRWLGVSRWRWLATQRHRGRFRERAVPVLPPRGEVEMAVEIVPLLRGPLRFTGLSLARPDPFNLLRAFSRVPLPQSLPVLPRRYPLPAFTLPGSMKYQHGGVALASTVGESEEFVSLRDYRPGDPVRHVHWRSWARMGKPIVKEYEDEFFVRHALVLDTFLARGDSEVFEEAISVAASFACTLQTQDSLLDLMFVGTEAYHFTSGRGLAHTDQILEILASVQVCRERPFHSLEHLVAEHVARVSGCICILLAWDGERQKLVRRLEAAEIPLLVMVLAEPGRAGDIAQTGYRPERFHVLETGRVEEGLARL
ncbi:MAG TPA: DUF58 domain-containing protein [Methylomirabilota bacterium]|nr:DUF58 domain-containing protein [Methylomirabilota bacterium]